MRWDRPLSALPKRMSSAVSALSMLIRALILESWVNCMRSSGVGVVDGGYLRGRKRGAVDADVIQRAVPVIGFFMADDAETLGAMNCESIRTDAVHKKLTGQGV